MTTAADEGGLFGVVESVPGLPDAVVGLAVGTICGKLVVRRRERRGKELRPAQFRRIEAAWITVCVVAALLSRLVVALL